MRADEGHRRGDLGAVKGKKIGAAPWVDYGLKRMLQEAGIDIERDEVDVAPVPGAVGPGVSFGATAARALEDRLIDGFVFYVGVRKTAAPGDHNANRLYARMFLEAIKRIDDYCDEDCDPAKEFVLILDEHEQRSELLTEAAKSMYGRRERRRHLVEPPFHLESHRYQTVQAADWIAGLVGRLGAIWADPEAWPKNEPFRRYFEHRLNRVSRRSGIRK